MTARRARQPFADLGQGGERCRWRSRPRPRRRRDGGPGRRACWCRSTRWRRGSSAGAARIAVLMPCRTMSAAGRRLVETAPPGAEQGGDRHGRDQPSTRSRTPPWPGMRLPLSLMSQARLAADSNRSPACSLTARTALSTAMPSVTAGRRGAPRTARQGWRRAPPRQAPAQVLLGDTAGASCGPPNPRPAK